MTAPMPDRSEIGEDEILVQVYGSEPDSMNRVHFYAFWRDPTPPADGGPPAGVRGQVFHADLAEFAAGGTPRGRRVRMWTPPADLGEHTRDL